MHTCFRKCNLLFTEPHEWRAGASDVVLLAIRKDPALIRMLGRHGGILVLSFTTHIGLTAAVPTAQSRMGKVLGTDYFSLRFFALCSVELHCAFAMCQYQLAEVSTLVNFEDWLTLHPIYARSSSCLVYCPFNSFFLLYSSRHLSVNTLIHVFGFAFPVPHLCPYRHGYPNTLTCSHFWWLNLILFQTLFCCWRFVCLKTHEPNTFLHCIHSVLFQARQTNLPKHPQK